MLTLHLKSSHTAVIPWHDPLTMAQAMDDSGHDYALLHSGRQTTYSGRYSIIAWQPVETLNHIPDDKDYFWLGIIPYEAFAPNFCQQKPAYIIAPPLTFTRYGHLLVYDHTEQSVHYYGDRQPPAPQSIALPDAPGIAQFSACTTQQEYLANVVDIIARIHAGECSQANLTRKFIGELQDDTPGFGLFLRLHHASPAPYSTYIKHQGLEVISSSPEQFLSISADGTIQTIPIKGSIGRNVDDATQDATLRQSLANSAKDRAENLMIVDLMRHDLAQICIPGSVQVPELFTITSHPTIHHMSSRIVGQLRPDITLADVLKATLPPGSMTGAPKHKAMDICSQLEPYQRGIYSGVIGYVSPDGSAQFAVTIRTIIKRGRQFEFQVGGGIVADSNPKTEYQETLSKAHGMCTALGIKI